MLFVVVFNQLLAVDSVCRLASDDRMGHAFQNICDCS